MIPADDRPGRHSCTETPRWLLTGCGGSGVDTGGLVDIGADRLVVLEKISVT